MDDDTIYRVTFVHGGQWQTVKSHNGQKYMYGKQFTEVIDQDKIAMIDLWEDIGPWANSTKPRPVRFTYMIPNSLPRKYVEVDNDVKLLQLFSQNREGKKFTLYVINNEDEDEPRPSTITSSLIAANQIEEECQVVREIHEVSSQSLQLSPVHPPPQHDASVQPPSEFNDMVSAALDNLDPPCEEEFNFGVEDLDVVDVFIRPDSELAMSDESKEGEEAYETIEDIVSGTDSDEVSSDKFESEFVEIDDERPNMNVGSKFSNVNHFRGALKQHCIINEFAVVYEKNEKSRVTARCKKRKCIWRIHASVLRDGVTFEVKTLKDEHTCTSVNKVGNEMATSGWLSNKIVPMLQKTPEIGPSRLRIEIQEKYNLTLPYSRNIVKDIGEYIVRRSSDVMAEVVGPEFTTVVRLDDKTCTCRAWQVTGLPCVHAAALITRIRGLDICDFVDEVYTVQRFRETYVVPIAPMPSKEFWDRVHLPFIVQPPRLYKQRGRPRKNRIRDPKEKKRTYMCTRCYELGHNKKSCKNPIAQSQSTGGSRRHNDEGTQESSMAGHQINNIASAEGGNMGGGVDGSSNIASGQGGSMGGGVQGAQTAWNAFNIQSNMGQITSQASVGSLTSQSAMNGTQTRVDSSRAESVMHGLTTQTTMGGMSMSVGEINGTVSMSVHDMGTTSHQGVRRNKSLGVRISERRLFKRPASAQGTLKMRTKRGGGALRIIDDPKNVS
ncbi:hypothetical protein QJS10_CPB11g01873 [Acorus calamus]|uniref:SWIM-type domain-containing protein n=1 Tax=Acorus calamus TaxID=4465 RepID=A0AAV9DRD1_ACOCL|nr:hypothetical protein QJS10_CPB11g01873 [Acorus calamus]